MKKNSNGFTLIELLIVIAIIGILAGVVLGSLNSARAKGRDAKRHLELRQIDNALTSYYDEKGCYPDCVVTGPLRSNVPAEWDQLAGWLTPYISGTPLDPLNNSEYFYTYSTDDPTNRYTLTANYESAPARTYATWNPAKKGTNVVLSDGDLTATQPGSYQAVVASIGLSSGKASWEITLHLGDGVMGVAANGVNVNVWIGSNPSSGWGSYTNGVLYGNGKTESNISTVFGNGDILTFYLDMDAGTLGIKVNGVDQGIEFTGLTGTIYPACTITHSGVTANFGQSSLIYPVAGYPAGVFIE